MLIPTSDRSVRYFYLGGPVDTARFRARRLAFVATVIYAGSLFGLVMLAHKVLDSEQALGQTSGLAAPGHLVQLRRTPPASSPGSARRSPAEPPATSARTPPRSTE